jgi:hypothetical protein
VKLLLAVLAAVAPPTHVVARVTPFTSTGALRPGLHVAQQRSGRCETGSDSVPTDVYRCSFGNVVADPCRREYRSVRPAVVCPQRPWDTNVVRVLLHSVAEGSPPSKQPLAAEPWGIELTSGARCLAAQGAHAVVVHEGRQSVVDYDRTNKLALLRGLARSGTTWTIRAIRWSSCVRPRSGFPRCPAVGSVPIEIAWFGGNNPYRR